MKVIRPPQNLSHRQLRLVPGVGDSAVLMEQKQNREVTMQSASSTPERSVNAAPGLICAVNIAGILIRPLACPSFLVVGPPEDLLRG